MATKSASAGEEQRDSHGFLAVLASAFYEWLLIILLFVNAIYSYLVTKFARFCKLHPPCPLCSSLDHILGNGTPGFFKEHLCSTHKLEISHSVFCPIHNKLADLQGMCESCLFAFATEKKSNAEAYRVLVGKLGNDLECYLNQDSLAKKSSSKNCCSCCAESWTSRSYFHRLLQTKSIGSQDSENEVALPGSARSNHVNLRDGMKKRSRKQSEQSIWSHLRNRSFDPLSHIGYSELKINSESESEVPFSDDDDASIVLDKQDGLKEELVSQSVELEPHTTPIVQLKTPLSSAPEKLIKQASTPGPSLLVEHAQLDVDTLHGVTSLKPTAAVGHGLEELSWHVAEPKYFPPTPPDCMPLKEVSLPSETTEVFVDAPGDILNSLGTSNVDQEAKTETGEACNSGSRQLMPTETVIKTDEVVGVSEETYVSGTDDDDGQTFAIESGENNKLESKATHNHEHASAVESGENHKFESREIHDHEQTSTTESGENNKLESRETHDHEQASGVESGEIHKLETGEIRDHEQTSNIKSEENTTLDSRETHNHEQASDFESGEIRKTETREIHDHEQTSSIESEENNELDSRETHNHEQESDFEGGEIHKLESSEFHDHEQTFATESGENNKLESRETHDHEQASGVESGEIHKLEREIRDHEQTSSIESEENNELDSRETHNHEQASDLESGEIRKMETRKIRDHEQTSSIENEENNKLDSRETHNHEHVSDFESGEIHKLEREIRDYEQTSSIESEENNELDSREIHNNEQASDFESGEIHKLESTEICSSAGGVTKIGNNEQTSVNEVGENLKLEGKEIHNLEGRTITENGPCMKVDRVIPDSGRPVSNAVDLTDAYKLAASMLTEQLAGKDSTRGSDDLKLLLSQVSAARGIELSSNEMSPRSHVNGEEPKLSDASSSMGLYMLPKRISVERNESGCDSLDGSIVSEIEGESVVDRLRRQVEYDWKSMSALYKELEEERNASAIAANQAMAMITRLQEEKAALHMEALQYLRMMEEQAEYDVDALQKANDLLAEKEREMQDLEAELEIYRRKFPNLSMNENVQEWSDFNGEDMEDEHPDVSFIGINADPPCNSLVSKESEGCNLYEKSDVVDGDNVISIVHDSLLVGEDERLYISECLQKLAKKLNLSSNDGVHVNISNGGHSRKKSVEVSDLEQDHCNHATHGNGLLQEDESSIQKDSSLVVEGLSTQESCSPSVGNNELTKKENHHSDSDAQDSITDGGTSLLALESEVSDLNERLEALEADRNFLEHTINALQIGDEGIKFVQEIAQQLREIRRICIRRDQIGT